MVYFELYEPSPSGPVNSTPVRFQMRIADAKTGAVVTKTELNAAEWTKQDSSAIRIAVKPVLDNLVPGECSLEIHAWDSAGRSTPWRVADFSIE